MDILDVFANNLKMYRTKKELSQEELAFRAELHRTYISAVERKKKNISIRNIEKIAKALEIEPYKLLIKETQDDTNIRWF